jgi:alkylation response protein AidB-like acyl-CoA dehydrogenase
VIVDRTFLDWPFFDDAHRRFAGELEAWAWANVADVGHDGGDVDAACRELVRRLGAGGWLRHVVPAAHGGAGERLDVRTLCLARETLARVNGLADFAFAMQGLGSGPITLFGTDEQRRRWLPPVATGERIAAFALSEPEAGSDVTAMRTTARRDGDGWVLDGTKTWISNAGIADHYVVFCRVADGEGDFAAFVVAADAPGLAVSERIAVAAPHPLGTLTLRDVRLPAAALVGPAGKGLRVALGTLDVFRSTVGAAALGFARRALAEAAAHAGERRLFGGRLADLQLTQARLADMAVAVDASALLVYRAAWTRDRGAERVTREAAMAKLYATEAAQRVVDGAVQLLGGRGVVSGEIVERLYREVRALRIYEGTSEVQRLVIASQLLRHGSQT